MKWFSPRARMLRRMHYAKNMDGMYHRYLRERQGWDIHLQHTRRFILEFVNHQSVHENVVVLGSGWLMDIPLQEIALQYKQVFLADILHPPQVIHKYRHLTNIRWIETDLTGGYVPAVYDLHQRGMLHQGSSLLEELTELPDAEFTRLLSTCKASGAATHFLSVNLLSQLDGMLVDFLKAEYRYPDPALLPFRLRIQQTHLSLLQLAGAACLVTDFTEEHLPLKGGAPVNKPIILADWPAGKHQESWAWPFDNSGSYIPHHRVKMLVQGVWL